MAVKTKAKKTTIYDFLFAFRKDLTENNITIPRSGTGRKPNGDPYKYAVLDEVILITDPLLQKHGLVYTQLVDGDHLVTILVATEATSDDNKLVSKIPLGSASTSQEAGSRITYMRRYALVPMLGLSIEEDLDSKPVDIQEAPAKPAQPQAEKPAEPAKAEAAETKEEKIKSAAELIAHRRTFAMSKPFSDAIRAIEGCQDINALEAFRDRIKSSDKITNEEKPILLEIINAKDTELTGTIHIQ